jgi:hypothetical protein
MAAANKQTIIHAKRAVGRKSLIANTAMPAAQITDVCSIAIPQCWYADKTDDFRLCPCWIAR